MTLGVLAERRSERGLTLEQAAAATRIRVAHLRALEAGDLEKLPAPVYARGYMRTYARYLGLDPDLMVHELPLRIADPRQSLSLRTIASRPRFTLTAPTAAAAGCLLLAAAFVLYAGHQIDSQQRLGSSPPAVVLAAPSPPATPAPTPAPQPKPIVVGVRVTDNVWLDVVVDGKSQYSDSGSILPAGSEVYFTGLDVKITSGKAAATFITVDDRPMGALGSGVATREFKSP